MLFIQLLLFQHLSILYEVSIDKTTLEIKESGVVNRADILSKVPITKITTIEFAKGPTEIGQSSFESFLALKRVSFSDSITVLRDSCFKSCSSLEEIVLADSIEIIENSVFSYCTSLVSITFPKNLQSIQTSLLLYDSNNLTYLKLKSGVNFSVDGNNSILVQNNNRAVFGITSAPTIYIPKYIEIIGSNFISHHVLVQEIVFEEGSLLSIVEENSFAQSGLRKIIFPEGLQTIFKDPFLKCYDLEEVYIPSTLKEFNTIFSVVPLKVTVGEGCEVLKVDPKTKVITNADKTVLVHIPRNTTEYTLPKTISNIDSGLIRGVTSLENFAVEPGSKYVSVQNLLYDSKNKTVLGCPGGLKIARIHDFCTDIGKYSFATTNVEEVYLGKNINTIQFAAFEKASKIRKFVLSNSLVTIGDYSLSRAYLDGVDLVFPRTFSSLGEHSLKFTNLRSVDFSACSNLILISSSSFTSSNISSIVFPSSLKSINKNAFLDCAKLTNVTFTSSINTLSTKAFSGCASLSEVIFATNEISKIEVHLFKGCGFERINIPESVITIDQEAFLDCKNLKEMIFGPNSKLATISTGVFKGCSKLKLVSFGRYLKEYKAGACSGADELTKIEVDKENENYKSSEGILYSKNMTVFVAFPGGLTSCEIKGNVSSIFDSAFYDCWKLTNLTFEADQPLKSIGSHTFYGCTGLKEISIPKKMSEISPTGFLGCTGLEVIKFSEGSEIEEIYEGTFGECKKLKSVIFEGNSSLKIIHQSAFKECEELREFDLPDSLEAIESMAFESCVSLKCLVFHRNISKIAENAFRGCSGLTYIRVCIRPGSKVDISEKAFSFTSISLKAHVIKGYGNSFGGIEALEYLDGDCLEPTFKFTSSASDRPVEIMMLLLMEGSQDRSDEGGLM